MPCKYAAFTTGCETREPQRAAAPCHTCVLLYSGEGLLEGVGSRGALSGVGRQAVGVHGLHGGVSVGLMRNAGEAVDDGRDDAGHGGGGYIGWWRTEACWEQRKITGSPLPAGKALCVLRQNDASAHSRILSSRLQRANANINSTGTRLRSNAGTRRWRESITNPQVFWVFFFFVFFCNASRRIAEGATCEK